MRCYISVILSVRPWKLSHRVRLGNLKRFKKNLDQNGLLEKKLGQKENRSRKFSRSKISNFFDFKKFQFSYNFQWFFRSQKFSENEIFCFFRSQNFHFSYNFQWKKFRDFRSQKFSATYLLFDLTFRLMKLWSISFFKITLDFQGGDDGHAFRAITTL